MSWSYLSTVGTRGAFFEITPISELGPEPPGSRGLHRGPCPRRTGLAGKIAARRARAREFFYFGNPAMSGILPRIPIWPDQGPGIPELRWNPDLAGMGLGDSTRRDARVRGPGHREFGVCRARGCVHEPRAGSSPAQPEAAVRTCSDPRRQRHLAGTEEGRSCKLKH